MIIKLLSNLFFVIMSLSAGFFIVLTGVNMIPQLVEIDISTFWITFYALGIISFAVLFVVISLDFTIDIIGKKEATRR